MAEDATGDEWSTVFRPYFTTKNGRKIYASDYGRKSWPIRRRRKRK